MIEYLTGNLFEYSDSRCPIIIHIVNNKGGFGKGFVVDLAKYYPQTKTDYYQWFKSQENFELGNILTIELPNVTVIHMLAQNGYSTPTHPAVDLIALKQCLNKVAKYASYQENPVIIGPKFGSGLGGQSWSKIEALIEETLQFPVIIFTL